MALLRDVQEGPPSGKEKSRPAAWKKESLGSLAQRHDP